MIRRNTWILLIILAVLLGFSFYLTNQKIKQAAQATPTSGSALLFNPNDGLPINIKVSDAGGNTVAFAKSVAGVWEVQAPIAMAADPGSAEAAASQISALQIINSVQLGLDIVGLDKPADTITVTFTGNKTHKLTVGSVTPIQNGYYAQLDNLQVQIVDKQGLDSILGLLTNPPYVATLTPAASPTSTNMPETPTLESTITPPPTTQTVTPTTTP